MRPVPVVLRRRAFSPQLTAEKVFVNICPHHIVPPMVSSSMELPGIINPKVGGFTYTSAS